MSKQPRPEYRTYRVLERDRQPLIDFIVSALRGSDCRMLHIPPANIAPFRFVFETPAGERMGIIAYAFYANCRETKNRPADEHRFQVKYGSKQTSELHELYQDPYALYTTLFLGINPEQGFFVGADPVLHSPTKFFISIEFKERHVEEILKRGWYAWERERKPGSIEPVEVLVGGTAHSFLRYIRFERSALREEPGHRQWVAENTAMISGEPAAAGKGELVVVAPALHDLAAELELSESEVLDLIESAPRLKMAVRGWVAEEHLYRRLRVIPGVTRCERIRAEGGADIRLCYRGSRPIEIECKNVLRKLTADGLARLDFQRTRTSKKDPCTRYYRSSDFDVVAACLHAVNDRWEYRYVLPARMEAHLRCPGRLTNNVRIDGRWTDDPEEILALAASAS